MAKAGSSWQRRVADRLLDQLERTGKIKRAEILAIIEEERTRGNDATEPLAMVRVRVGDRVGRDDPRVNVCVVGDDGAMIPHHPKTANHAIRFMLPPDALVCGPDAPEKGTKP